MTPKTTAATESPKNRIKASHVTKYATSVAVYEAQNCDMSNEVNLLASSYHRTLSIPLGPTKPFLGAGSNGLWGHSSKSFTAFHLFCFTKFSITIVSHTLR